MKRKAPPTRGAAAEKRAHKRQTDAERYAHLSTEQRKAKAARCNAMRKKVSKIDGDRAKDQQARVQALKVKVGGAKKRIKALSEANEELEKAYAVTPEEPSIDGVQAKAAEAAFDRAYKDPPTFQRLTNETPEEFEELWSLLKDALAKITYDGKKRVRSAGQRQLLPDRVQLFIALLFLRQYPTYALLSFLLGGLSPLSLHHYIFRVLVALSDLDELAIKWPTDNEMKEHVKKPPNWPYPDKRNLVAAIDGTEIRVPRPSKYAIGNAHYSAKKRQYALNVLLVVLLSGVIIYCSPPTAKMNDQGLFNECGIRVRFIGKPWGIIGDSGFTFNSKEALTNSAEIIAQGPNKQPKGRKKAKKAAAARKKAIDKIEKAQEKAQDTIGVVKKKRSKDRPSLLTEEVLMVGAVPPPPVIVPSLSSSARTHNIELSRMRVVVENTNARLKIYKVLGSKLRHYRPGARVKKDANITPALIVTVVVGLTNRHIKRSPCRSIAWVPQKVTTDDLASPEGSECDSTSSSTSDSDE